MLKTLDMNIGSSSSATGMEVGKFGLAIMLFKINSHQTLAWLIKMETDLVCFLLTYGLVGIRLL